MQIFTGFFYLEKFFLKFFEVLEWYEGGVITPSPPPSFDNGVIPRGSNQTRLLSYIDKQIHSSKYLAMYRSIVYHYGTGISECRHQELMVSP